MLELPSGKPSFTETFLGNLSVKKGFPERSSGIPGKVSEKVPEKDHFRKDLLFTETLSFPEMFPGPF